MGVHDGHRDRMRQRFLRESLESFADHEVLEILLYFSISRSNTNDKAHALLSRFGSLASVLSASPAELQQVDGIGERSAMLLSLVHQLHRRIRLQEADTILDSRDRAGAYLLHRFSGEKHEVVYLLCLDGKGKLLSCHRVRDGTLTSADLDIRRVVECAILSCAASVILSHNHPSGLALPSAEDYIATDKVKAALETVSVTLQDHIIVADGDYVSMRDSGYL